MPYIIASVIVVIVVVLYVVTYAINEKTAIPEECRDLADSVACSACNIGSCAAKKTSPGNQTHVK